MAAPLIPCQPQWPPPPHLIAAAAQRRFEGETEGENFEGAQGKEKIDLTRDSDSSVTPTWEDPEAQKEKELAELHKRIEALQKKIKRWKPGEPP